MSHTTFTAPQLPQPWNVAQIPRATAQEAIERREEARLWADWEESNGMDEVRVESILNQFSIDF